MGPNVTRRQALVATGGLLGAATPGWGQPGRSTRPAIAIAQLYDTSPSQQDVSKDFLIGSRAAWQDINARGGLRGRTVQHMSIEVDATAASVRSALASIRDNPACIALSGTAGDPCATQLAAALRQDNLALAHVAPWLQNSSVEVDEHTFPIFATRQEQIGYALKSLASMGMAEAGAVYASPRDYERYHDTLERVAAELKMRLKSYRAGEDLVAVGQGLGAASPAILLFIGGTPELVQLTQGLERQSRQRYVVALADVNLQTMMQMGAARNTPVIATQAVPMVNASLPVVRSYREVLTRLFDEPPTPLSLAGFIAARYTYEVLDDVEGPLTRQSALAAFQRRANMDVGGFRVSYDSRRRGGTYVTQSMLTVDGRVIG